MGAEQSAPADGRGRKSSKSSKRASTAKASRESTYSGFGDVEETSQVGKEHMAALHEALGGGSDNIDLVKGLATMNGKSLTKLEAFLENRLNKLKKQIEQLSANSNAGFIQAYQGIRAGQGNPATASKHGDNRSLNRYNNIVAYDHSRLKVKKTPANHNNDYINANWIPGYGKNKYIASQGPVPASFPSFWQMIWEQGSQIIVMVTNEVEGGKLKCHRYWPNQEEGRIQMGEITIEMTFQEVHATYVTRHFSLSHAGSKETRDLTQFAYTAWPDHGVPATTKELLNFRRIIKDSSTLVQGPVTVHCSAGVGRTGTFIGCDQFIDYCLAMKDVEILSIVEEMRKSRNFMVQSQIQFMYLYLVNIDALERMLKSVRRQRFFGGMTEAEISELKFNELKKELASQENVYDTIKKKKKRVIPDVRHAVGAPTDDLKDAGNVPITARLHSAAASASPGKWRDRQNVPTGTKALGYEDDQAAGLEQRLSALVVSKSNWKIAYEQAKDDWKLQQDDNDNTYNVGEQMSPLESRLQSLSMAETAWLYRGDGFRSAKEADVRANLASLTARLESLHHTILSSEARWKMRGDGFREGVEGDGEQHTDDNIGTLLSRLQSLQKDTTKWVEREQAAVTKFKEGSFTDDVKQERQVQEDKRKAVQKKEVDMFTRLKEQREKEEQDEQARQKQLEEDKKEEDRMAAIKARMTKAANVEERFVSPAEIAKKAKGERERAEKEKKALQEQEKAKKQIDKQKKEEAKKNQKTKLSQRANKFLDKLQ